jgi:glycerol kinase
MAEEVERLASSVHDSGGVYLVPAFVGLGAPYWRESARGLISGLTRGSTAADLARAAIESIAYQVRDVFDVMEAESGAPLQTLLADGGASRNDTLMQFQADIIGRPVLRSTSVETSVLGAAYLAGLAVGLWRTDGEIAALVAGHDRFEPLMSQLRRAELYAGWQAAVARAVLQP